MNIAVTTKPKVEMAELEAALLVNLGADGVYARTSAYEAVIEGLGRLITRHRAPETEVFRFPPVMRRRDIQRAGYLKSFPHLLGCVCAFGGDEAEIRASVDSIGIDDDFASSLSGTDLVLTPAACYPIYPIAAARGPVGASGLIFDVACDCFRREPSRQLDRLQSFRMREFVRIGSPEQVKDFREAWIERAQDMAKVLGLSAKVEVASDPFFGRGGQLTAISQMQQSLKFELLVPVRSTTDPTACMSFNYHRSHFGETWNLRSEAGETLHTGCIAFGLDRLALALFATHGLERAQWPRATLEALEL
jgi:seryl-tRNA synthetase